MGGGPERPIELTDAEAADMSKPDFRQAAQAGRPGRSSHGSSDKAKTRHSPTDQQISSRKIVSNLNSNSSY